MRPTVVAASLLLSLLLSLLTLQACGGPELERLQGDPKAAEALTVSPDRRTAAAVDGLRRFIAAVEEGAIEVAWLHLSRQTRAALHRRAQPIGMRGVDLLRPAPAGAAPGERALHVADPIATFAMRGAVQMKAGKPPYPPYRPVDGRTITWEVELSDAAGHRKRVTMRFEGRHWRIHAPKLGR